MQDCVNFAAAVPEGKECKLLLYRTGKKAPCASFPMEESVGEIHAAAISGIDISAYEYNYEIDGRVVPDPYAAALSGRRRWLKEGEYKEHEVRSRLCQDAYDWEGDMPVHLPYHRVIAYTLHVRGFTKDASSKVKQKGTFQGVVEKLEYLKELGVNQIQCMPVYEFDEYRRQESMERVPESVRKFKEVCIQRRPGDINYWGYGKAYYFAPKSAYSADGDGVRGLKDMVKAFHREKIEVVLEMPFTEGISNQYIVECLRYYVLEYHIDGFVLNPYVAPMGSIYSDPVLKKTKIMKHQEGFQNVMRRFLKGDEGMVDDVIYWLRHNSRQEGIFNYIASHTGFTLNDLVSYDKKHNEANGENNQDGPDYNYSWNCGAEGPSRKRGIMALRRSQIRNAFFLLLLAQGTPCILAGDEFGNSQKGNNNVYCQDNPTGWVNWKDSMTGRELFEFVKELIKLRKTYPLFSPEEEPLGIDRAGSGIPDVSYHGESAWRVPSEISSRQLGVYYSAALPESEDCFVVYNMHWLAHSFALPALLRGKSWYLAASTGEGVLEEPVLLENQRRIETEARTIMMIVGRKTV